MDRSRRNFLFLAAAFAIVSLPLRGHAATEAKTPSKETDSLSNTLDRAANLEAAEKFCEAEKVYKRALKKLDLNEKSKKRLIAAQERLNLKMILSPHKSPGSKIHKVKEGESLKSIAIKYRTTVELIKKSNRLKSEVIHPGMKLKVLSSAFSISVDKSDNEMTLYQGKRVIKHYRVATGIQNNTPVGEFKIANKIANPTWYKGADVIPPGSAENYLGTRWLGFDIDSYGIHGTNNPESIGTQSSSGCIRMFNKDVEQLFVLIPIGTKVKITD